jgi:hypothetical protein
MNLTTLTPAQFTHYMSTLGQLTTVKPGTQLEDDLLAIVWSYEDTLTDDEIDYLSTL